MSNIIKCSYYERLFNSCEYFLVRWEMDIKLDCGAKKYDNIVDAVERLKLQGKDKDVSWLYLAVTVSGEAIELVLYESFREVDGSFPGLT